MNPTRIRLPLLLGGLLLATAAFNAPAAPLLEYTFDDVSQPGLNTGTLTNLADGQLVNAAWIPENAPLGQGGSAQFNGLDSYIRVPNAFSYGDQLTVEAWIKPDRIDSQLVIWDDYGNPGVLLAVKGGVVQFGVSTPLHPDGGISLNAGPLKTNAWQHVAGVYNGQHLRVFVNGMDTGIIVSTSGNIQENGPPPAIGSDNSTTTALNFKGLIDDFRIHTRALTAEELADGRFVRLWIDRPQPGRVRLYWPKPPVPYRLQEFFAKDGSWRDVSEEPVPQDGRLSVARDARADIGLYRLIAP